MTLEWDLLGLLVFVRRVLLEKAGALLLPKRPSNFYETGFIEHDSRKIFVPKGFLGS